MLKPVFLSMSSSPDECWIFQLLLLYPHTGHAARAEWIGTGLDRSCVGSNHLQLLIGDDAHVIMWDVDTKLRTALNYMLCTSLFLVCSLMY